MIITIMWHDLTVPLRKDDTQNREAFHICSRRLRFRTHVDIVFVCPIIALEDDCVREAKPQLTSNNICSYGHCARMTRKIVKRSISFALVRSLRFGFGSQLMVPKLLTGMFKDRVNVVPLIPCARMTRKIVKRSIFYIRVLHRVGFDFLRQLMDNGAKLIDWNV